MCVVRGEHDGLLVAQLLHFQFIESLAIDTLHIAHRHKGVGVNYLDGPENLKRLTLAGDAHQHVALGLRVPAFTGQHRHTMPHLVDGVGDFGEVARENHELNRLALTVHHVVQRHTRDNQRGKTKHHAAPVVEHEIAGADNHHIAGHDHETQTYVAVFMHDGGDDVRAAGRTIAQEADCQTHAFKNGTDHAGHECLVLTNHLRKGSVGILHQTLCQPNQESQRQHSIDGLHAELPAQHLQCHNQKHGVDHQVGVLNLKSGHIIHNRSDTRHTACRDLIRQHEAGQRKGIHRKGYRDHQIVPHFKPYLSFQSF